jgi:hypothetical protein
VIEYTADKNDPTGRRGWLTFTGKDREGYLDKMLRWAIRDSFRTWEQALVAWILNTP